MAAAGPRPSDLRDALRLHLATLPADAPVRGLLASDPIERLLSRFDAADATAIKEQAYYRRSGRLVLWATMAGTVVGALVLLPIDRWTTGWPRIGIQMGQATALTLSLVATWWTGWYQPVSRWLRARATAEVLRGDAFRAIIQAGAEARGTLAGALACFKDAHLEWQLGYYRRRAAQHRRSAGNAAPYKLLGYLVLAVAVLIGAVGFVNLLARLDGAWSWIKALAQWIPLEETGRWQLGLGVMSTSILAFASARSFMDQDDRHAVLCELADEHLEEVKRLELAKTEAAAAAGDATPVVAFCERVQGIMSAEHLAWAHPRHFDGETAPAPGTAPAS
jgi:hypothetical protein